MSLPHAAVRYRAVSMELTADLDACTVEMRVLADTGKTIAVVCPRASIFTIQKHIEKMGRECPEIATWSDERGARLKRAETLSSFLERGSLKERTS